MGSCSLYINPGLCDRGARVIRSRAADVDGAVAAEPACELPTPGENPCAPLALVARGRSRSSAAAEGRDDGSDERGGPALVPAAGRGHGEGPGERESGVGTGSGFERTESGLAVQGAGGRKRKAAAASGAAAGERKRRPR